MCECCYPYEALGRASLGVVLLLKGLHDHEVIDELFFVPWMLEVPPTVARYPGSCDHRR